MKKTQSLQIFFLSTIRLQDVSFHLRLVELLQPDPARDLPVRAVPGQAAAELRREQDQLQVLHSGRRVVASPGVQQDVVKLFHVSRSRGLPLPVKSDPMRREIKCYTAAPL